MEFITGLLIGYGVGAILVVTVFTGKFKKKIIMAQGENTNYKINTLLSWLDAADQTNNLNIITSVTLFSDGSGRIIQEEKIVDDFFTIEEALEKLETIVNTQKSC